jgi:protein O-mannosyl-transferase
MLVTLPFVLLLLDYWPLNRFQNTRLSRLVFEKIPFLAVSVVLSIVTFEIQLKMALVKTVADYSMQWRIENALVSYLIYIEKIFWPVNLAIFYPHPRGGIPSWQVAGAVFVLALITLMALWKSRQRPYIVVGWLWFLGTLVPVIGIIQVGLQAWADRYTYIPYIGLFIVFTWGVSDLLAKLPFRKLIFSMAAAVLLFALCVKTYIQTIYWHDNITLYSHAVKVVKNNWWAHYFLGDALASRGEYEEAIIQFKKSLALDPQYTPAYNDMAKAYLDKGDVNESVKLYRQELPPLPQDSNEPPHGDFLPGDNPVSKECYVNANINLAIGLSRQGNLKEAARRFREALRVAPDAKAARQGLEYIKNKTNDSSLLP